MVKVQQAMKKKKILVIGNCQAGPVVKLVQSTGAFDCHPPILLQHARSEDAIQHQDLIDASDIVFAQLTVDTFKLPHLRSSQIKQQYPGKTIIWPNVFYAGQQPYLRYMTHLTEGRILGPLEALHDIRIFRKWLIQRGKIRQADWVEAPDFVASAGAASLQELQSREQRCDVHVVDLIQGAPAGERLFFTFNHPNNWLLARVTERMLGQVGVDAVIDEKGSPEYLSRYITPSSWSGNPAYPEPFRGVNIILKTDNIIQIEGRCDYTWGALEDAFMACYDHMEDKMVKENLRFTPDFGEPF